MYLDTKPFPELLSKCSNELSIEPKLLLFAVTEICRDPQVTGDYIIQRFMRELLDKMRQKAEKQLKSTNKRSREAGEYALTNVDENSFIMRMTIIDDSPVIDSITRYAYKDEPIKNYHIEAWKYITGVKLKIRKRFMKKTGEFDIAEIIKKVCPEIIKQCREISN
jgi:hypothetical protein